MRSAATALDVGVGANDGGVVAAELKVHFLQRVGGVLEDLPPGGGAAGHRHQLHAVGANQRRADDLAEPRHDLVRGLGQPRGLHHLGDADDGQRAFLRRLGDDRVAGGERARRFVRPQLGRIVERHDGGDDAERLTHGDGERPLESRHGVERRDLAEHTLGLFGVTAPDADRRADFAECLAARLAVFLCEQAGERLTLALDRVSDAHQDRATLMRRDGGDALLAELSRGDRALDVLGAAARRAIQSPSRGRIDDLVDRSTRGADPSAVDQHSHGVPLPLPDGHCRPFPGSSLVQISHLVNK